MIKISRNTRPARAARKQAEVLIENIHLLYLDDNALEYLQSLIEPLELEFERRIPLFVKKLKERKDKKENVRRRSRK